MKNCPIAPVALLAVVILLTAPVALTVQLVHKQGGVPVGAGHVPCLHDDVACQLRDLARFVNVVPQFVGSLLARNQSPMKRG
jgi:hypothetical protein